MKGYSCVKVLLISRHAAILVHTVTFSEEDIKLTNGLFEQWFINKSPDTNNAGSDDDLLFFVRNSVDKVFIIT